MHRVLATLVFGLLCLPQIATADLIVSYALDGGGNNAAPLNGLAARATFSMPRSDALTILLENTSTGLPDGFEVSDSLLVSLGLNLPVDILSGDAAVIGPNGHGLGTWSTRGPGASVAEQWLWTNDYGGDLMESWRQVISTSNGQGGGTTARFDGLSGTVDGPFGGIAADPPLLGIPANQPAVAGAIRFDLTLTGPLTDDALQAAALGSIVEFGSDARYLQAIPEPASALLLALAGLLARRR